MLKRIIIPLLTLLVGVSIATPVHASAPAVSVVKTSVYTGAKTYTASIDHATAVSAVPRDSAILPSTTGGCHLVFHVNTRNHAKIIDALYCDAPGTIAFRTPATYSCGVTFTLTAVDGLDSTVYSDALTNACPPPPPPSVTSVYDGTAITFTNPATIAQDSLKTITVSEQYQAFTSADPFTVSYRTNFAGIGINKYVYFTATISVSLAPGQTITVTKA